MRVETINNDYQIKNTQSTYMNGMESNNIKPSQMANKRANKSISSEAMKNATAQAETGNNQETKSEENEKIVEAIDQANKHLRIYNRRLEYEVHEATNHIMVKVINSEDDKIIREIPSEKILDMIGRIWDVAGLLVDEKR